MAGTFALATALLAPPASARKQHFEPTDLELEDTGTLDVDLQMGLVRGPDTPRLVLPDLELDLGVAPNVEVDFDTAYGIERPSLGHRLHDHGVVDNGWLSAKLGLWSVHDEAKKTSWGLGLQTGPKLPFETDARGAGYEALFLLARRMDRTHLVLDLGGLVDPGETFSTRRPIGAEVGLDFTEDLDANATFSIIANAGAVIYATHDPDELELTAGLQYEPFDALDLSIVGLVGPLSGSDRYGALLGVSPKFKLW